MPFSPWWQLPASPGCSPPFPWEEALSSLGRKSTASGAGLQIHTEGTLTGISIRDHLESQLPPGHTGLYTGQGPGSARGSFVRRPG